MVFLLLLGLGVFAALYPVWVLSFTIDENIVYVKAVRPGDTFDLVYLHSIALSDVWEHFRIDSEHRIVLTETRFQGQGAGLPYGASPGEKWTREGRWFHLTGMKRIVPSICWRVQKEWHDRFRFDRTPEVDFSRRLGNALVLIQVQKMSLFSWLRYSAGNWSEEILHPREGRNHD